MTRYKTQGTGHSVESQSERKIAQDNYQLIMAADCFNRVSGKETMIFTPGHQ